MKYQELKERAENLREDMQKYLSEYLIPLARGHNFEKYNFYIEWKDDTSGLPLKIPTKVMEIDFHGDLILNFDGSLEDVELDYLGFIAIIDLVWFLEEYVNELS